jgi:hypothetical protein
MDTVQAIFWTQVPIAIAILIGAYELYRVRRELLELLSKLAEKKIKKK